MYSIKFFENGFEYIEIQNSILSAKIALQGAHIFEFKRKNCSDVLWLSECSSFEKGVAIRGGIPICWPRFGVLDKSMPAHGFSRTALFELVEVKEVDAQTTEVKLLLKDNATTREIWDFSFRLEVKLRLCEHLTVSLKTTNCDVKEFMITQALHSYLQVSDIKNVEIFGLENKPYLDTLTNVKSKENRSLIINTECDRVYQNVEKNIVFQDKNRKVILSAKGSDSVVVWNPWVDKGSRMSGMRADAYREFVCIETANAFDDFRLLQAGESHTLSVTF